MDNKTVLGFAICGSFCTLTRTLDVMQTLSEHYDILPIMSEVAFSTDTRFGSAQSFKQKIENICQKPIIHTIASAEPIGPKRLCDIMLIAPCTGNTLAKLANGITDTCVTMAAKAHLRNSRPLVIAISTNDALSNSAKNIGALMNYKNIYFVPFSQDDHINKERSCVADLSLCEITLKNAIMGKQIQPIIK